MAFSCMQMATPSPPIPTIAKDQQVPVPRRTGFVPADQASKVGGKSMQDSPLILASRRDAIACMTLTLAANIFKIDPVEARTVKPETRRKIKEKLDKIREKAGVPNRKENPDSGDREKQLIPFNSLTTPLVEVAM